MKYSILNGCNIPLLDPVNSPLALTIWLDVEVSPPTLSPYLEEQQHLYKCINVQVTQIHY